MVVNIMKNLRIIKFSVSLCLLLSTEFAIADNAIIVWNRLPDNPVSYKILQRALDVTSKEFGRYQLAPSIPIEQGRMIVELTKNQRVHVASFAPTKEREQALLPVRIPVNKGLLGYRVCLIKQGEQNKFSDIRTLEEWKKKGLTIGQGTHWPDTGILESNGIKVVKSAKYDTLFTMLSKKRYDCFSRSVTEVLPELEKYKALGLVLEKKLMLVYRLPSFFFVSRKNAKLAQRLEKGMHAMLKTGELDKILNQYYRELFNNIDFDGRHIIELKNNLLTDKTNKLSTDSKLWIK